jgi:hypothetical protein
MTLAESQEAIAHFKSEYAKLRKEYPDLPAYEQFTEEIDALEFISRSKLFPVSTLRFCRWHMMESVGSWMGYLHGFILPNQQNAASMEEYNYLSDADKREVVKILNWNMFRVREANLLQLNEDDEKTAIFISEFFKEWLERKKIVSKLVEKTMVEWKKKV